MSRCSRSIRASASNRSDPVGSEAQSIALGVPIGVDGLARNLKAFLDFERALIRSPYFSRVEPERTDVDDRTSETVFSLKFLYKPGPSDRPSSRTRTPKR